MITDIAEVLNLWSNGAVTLPKAWREQFDTKHYMAIGQPDGTLLLKPVLMEDNIFTYENEKDPEDGELYSGVRFVSGIPTGELLKEMKQIHNDIECNKTPKRRQSAPKRKRSTKR